MIHADGLAFWNIVGFAGLVILLLLVYTVYRGILNTDENRAIVIMRRVVSLVFTFVLWVVVSWLVMWSSVRNNLWLGLK